MADSLERLVNKAEKRAAAYGGLIAILFVIKTRSSITFDITTGFSVGRKLISIGILQNEIQTLEDKLSITMLQYAKNLSSGKWVLSEWLKAMQELLGESHLLFGALAIGSITAASRNNIVINRYSSDIKYLRGFAKDIEIGKIFTMAAIARRSKSYLRSAHITFGNVVLQLSILAGFTEVKRILRAVESCKGCLHWGGRWVPIRTMPTLGSLNCKIYCKCYFLYR